MNDNNPKIISTVIGLSLIALIGWNDSVEARTSNTYSSRGMNAIDVNSIFNLVDRTSNEIDIQDELANNFELGLFLGAGENYGSYSFNSLKTCKFGEKLTFDNLGNPLTCDDLGNSTIPVQPRTILERINLRSQFISNNDINGELGWSVGSAFTFDLIRYSLVETVNGNTLEEFFVLGNRLLDRGLNSQLAVNDLNYIVDNDLLNLAILPLDARARVELLDSDEFFLSGPELESSKSIDVKVPESSANLGLVILGIINAIACAAAKQIAKQKK
jgi:hypothetical protein